MLLAFGKKIIFSYIFKRSNRLRAVQRFLLVWLGVFGLVGFVISTQFNDLKGYYLTEKPALGGVYVEGVVGEFSAFNPLFSDALPSQTVNKLIFSGLTKRDQTGAIKGDLAQSWETKRGGAIYEVKLRPGLKWHDGQDLTAKDVVFTIGLIQNSAVRSPLRSSWQGVVVKALNDNTLEFKLPAPFSPFPQLLTVGIVPQHLLGKIDPDQLRVANFNQVPVGSGPYLFNGQVGDDEVRLSAFEQYAHGSPSITNIRVKAFADYSQVAEAFRDRELTGVGGFGPADNKRFINSKSANSIFWDTSQQTYLFMNNSRPVLSSLPIRRAISSAIDTHALAKEYPENFKTAHSPLLPEHLGYDGEGTSARSGVSQASAELDKAGWSKNQDGWRQKGKQKLKLKLVSADIDVYPLIASQIINQLKSVGIEVELVARDVKSLQTNHIAPRDYDLLLFTIALGADPDIYAYWHSSQSGPGGLNFSNYKSSVADASLEAGRTRLLEDVRKAKYRVFLQTWRNDVPAVGLYRQSYPYVTRGIKEIDIKWLPEPLDRFNQVHTWSLKNEFKLRRLVE